MYFNFSFFLRAHLFFSFSFSVCVSVSVRVCVCVNEIVSWDENSRTFSESFSLHETSFVENSCSYFPEMLASHKCLYRVHFVWILVVFRAQRWSQNKLLLIEQILK